MAAATARMSIQDRDDNIFASVFAPKHYTTPTPEATPNIGTLASPGAAFGGFDVSSSPADAAVRLTRSWSTVTRFLTLTPDGGKAGQRSLPTDVSQCLSILLDGGETQRELTSWYMHEVRNHSRQYVLPKLAFWHRPIAVPNARDSLLASVNVLQSAQACYLGVFSRRSGKARTQSPPFEAFRLQLTRDVQILLLHSLPRVRIEKTMTSVLFRTMKQGLEDHSNPEACLKHGRCSCDLTLGLDLLCGLADIGFGGSMGERALATAVHHFIERPAIDRRCFQVDWIGKGTVANVLREWIATRLQPAIAEALAAITSSGSVDLSLSQLSSIAVNRFGKLRIESLFDYVKLWPNSQGAILDIKEYLDANGTAEKAYLCSTFANQIDRRILHAGASTVEILSVYINVINVFKALDPRGVLLEKVAVPIRDYLRRREDTVSIIAASLLADADRDNDAEKICIDLALEAADSKIGPEVQRALNYSDMDWVPDPIDAGPNFKSSKNDDVVAQMLGLVDPEDFAQAFHNALGSHLLRAASPEFVRETKLIELLKSRLDSAKAQSFEVMLKDMRDSIALNRRINPDRGPGVPTPKEIQAAIPFEGITLGALYSMFEGRMNRRHFTAAVQLVAKQRDDLLFPKRTRLPPEASEQSAASSDHASENPLHVNVKLISNYYWPTRRAVEPRLPSQLDRLIPAIEASFEATTGGNRKMKWDHASGSAKLVLELEDRTFEDDEVDFHKVITIDAFASQRSSNTDHRPIEYDASIGLSVPELVEALSLPEDLVMDAISYWTGHHVLYQVSPGRYAVLERIDMPIEPIVQESTEAPLSAEDAILRQNAAVYQAFVINMLRNTAVRQVEGDAGITSFMRMMVPDFAYGDREVKWLLQDMMGRGEVKQEGEVWSAV